jgi:8-oxo-dGTP diphosphatase
MAIDLVIVSNDGLHIWLVRRKDTSQLATMGGFVDVKETVEQAVHRELREEMGIVLDSKSEQPVLLGIYSDPKRDNRRRNISSVFVVRLTHDIEPTAADDANDVQKIHIDSIEEYDYFADHKTILLDYRQSLRGGGLAGPETVKSGVGDAASNQAAIQIQRSVCTTR